MRKRLSIYLLFAAWLALILSPLARAATISVNTKSELTSAIASINPGDTISIENGTYTNWGQITIPHTSDCTSSQRCTLTAQTEGSVVFSGQGALTLDIRSRYWTITKLKWTGQTSFGNFSTPVASSTGSLIVFDGAQDTTVDDITISSVSGTGVVIAVMKNLGTRDTLRNTLSNSTFSGFTHTASGSTFIYILAKSDRGYNTNFNIIGNLFENRVGSPSANTQYWIRYGNGNGSSYLGGGNNLVDSPRDSNLLIQGNTFRNVTQGSNGQDCLHLKASYVEFRDNVVQNETRVVFRNGQNDKIIGNKFINPVTSKTDHGLFIADIGHELSNNLFYSTRGDKTAIQLSKGTTDTDSDNNLDYKPFSGSLLHNTFDGFSNESVMAAKNSTGNNEGTTTVQPTIVDFQNNVIRQQAGVMVDGSSCATLFSGNVDHNAWSGSATPDCITQSGAGDVTSAPQWVNPAGGDYHLQSSSPLRDAGLKVTAYPETTVDIEGNQRDSTYDIGAYEYGATSPPVSDCDNIFGGVSDYILCEETSVTCKFNATLGGSDCDTLCGNLGKACVGAFDNTSPGCVETGTDTCSTVKTDEICVCEIADQGTPPSTGVFYVDSSCGTQGNGLTTTCGANGPWTSLEYALETVDCAGMSPGDVLEVRGMTTTPSAGNWYTDTYYSPSSSIDVDSACSGITVRPYSGATEHVVVDGTIDLSGLTWTSLGSGVYESATTSLTTWPHRAYYKRGANPEEELDLIQSAQTCSTALAVDKMRYNPISKTVCAHLSDGSSPAASTYFRVPARLYGLNFRLEDVDDVSVESSGPTFLITRFANSLVLLDTGTNQNITLSGLTLSEAREGGILAEGSSGLGDYNISNNTISNIGETAIRLQNYLGSPTIIGNTISGIGLAPNFEQCNGVGAGCQAGYNSPATGIWLNNCVTLDDVTRATVQDNALSIGQGYSGLSYGIHLDDCTHANLIDSNLITDSTASSQTGFRGIAMTGIPAGQYHDHNQITNNRCEEVDYCFVVDYDTATDQSPYDNFVYGNTCSNPNTTCWIQLDGANVDGEMWFQDNLASTDDGDGVLLMSIPSSTLWDSARFSHNAFECDHANCSGATIATFQGNNYKRAGDCTPTTDCIEDINANGNIYGACNVTATSLDLPSGSACIDAGVNLTFLPTDYKKLSRPFGSTSDIGAHEYDGTAPSTNLTQAAWRCGDRFKAITDAPLALENRPCRLYAHSQFSLRFAITGDSGTSSHLADFALYYRRNGGSYVAMTPTCAGNYLCYVDDPNRENGVAISNGLTLGSRVFLTESAFYDTAEDGIEATISDGDQLELEFSIGMGANATLADVYDFQVREADGTALNTYSETPSLTVGPILGAIFQAQ